MSALAKQRTYLICGGLFFLAEVVSLALAGYAGWAWSELPTDQILIQQVFYGAWASLIGARMGGLAAIGMEEDACSGLDMGVLSSMGGFFGGLDR